MRGWLACKQSGEEFEELVVPIAEHRRETRIDEYDPAGVVDHDDALGSGLENRSQRRVAGASIALAVRHGGLELGDTTPKSADLGLEIVLCRHGVSIIAHR